MKDFKRHKSNGGTAQPTTVDAIESFKRSKKGSRNGRSSEASSSHRGSTDKRSTDKKCSKCSTIHAYRDCPAFGKKCHKCGNKNHFSSCCRSNVSQDKGRRRDRSTRGRSPERRHRPSRGRRSRSRSWSQSSGESVTRSAHSIEVDRYDIDDIDMLRTFHSVYRLTVASQSNDTDPDGKTKIVTKIGIKLPHR